MKGERVLPGGGSSGVIWRADGVTQGSLLAYLCPRATENSASSPVNNSLSRKLFPQRLNFLSLHLDPRNKHFKSQFIWIKYWWG